MADNGVVVSSLLVVLLALFLGNDYIPVLVELWIIYLLKKEFFDKLMRRAYARRGELILIASLMLLAFYARTRYVVGFGLGDDSYYAWTSYNFMMQGFKAVPPDFPSNYRVGLWIPISASFKLLGINDWSYVLFPLVSSTLLVIVVYLLGTELVGPEAGFFAGLIQAVSTFDLSFATTMTIDIPAAFLLALGILLFLKAEKKDGFENSALNAGSAVCTMWAYFIKIPSLSILLVYLTLTALRRNKRASHLVMYCALGTMLAATFIWDYHVSGNPIQYIQGELRVGPKSAPLVQIWRLYPEWMFTNKNSMGVHLFGFHFWLAAAAALYCLADKGLRDKAVPALVWFTVTFIFLEFFPTSLEPPLKVSFRFFRYAYAFVPPASLISGAALAWLYRRWAFGTSRGKKHRLNWKLALLYVFVLVYAGISINQGLDLAKRYVDHYNDPRYAVRYIASLPPKPVYGDYIFLDRFNFETGYERIGDTRWDVNGVGTNIIVKDKDVSRLRNISRGYVVFGGARGMDASPQSVLQTGSFKPPKKWHLIYEDDKPLDANRWEPLRVYSIKK